MRHTRAELRWVPPEAGGRSRLPPDSPYTTVATFAEAETPDQSWSLVCTFEEQSQKHTTAHVHFLLEDAPHHLLRPGAAFELREGENVVAHGAVESIVAEDPVSER